MELWTCKFEWDILAHEEWVRGLISRFLGPSIGKVADSSFNIIGRV